MYEYENKLEILNGQFPDPENWVVYLDPENNSPSIIASTIKDEWFYPEFSGTGEELIMYYTRGRIGRSRSDSVNITSLVKYHFDKYNLWS